MRLPPLPRHRRLWAALALLALLAGAHASGLARLLSLETLAEHRAALMGFIAAHRLAAALAYLAAYTTVVALSVPGAVLLTLAGGMMFGAMAGTLLTVTAATAGATLVFLFARGLLGDDALSRLGPRAAALSAGLRRNAASYLLVLRLVPLFPFFLVNLVPALVGVGLPTFVVTTLLGILPATAVFTLAGTGLGELLARGESLDPRSVLTPTIVAALAGLALLSLAAIPLRAWAARARPAAPERPARNVALQGETRDAAAPPPRREGP